MAAPDDLRLESLKAAGMRLREARALAGMSQQEASAKIGCSQTNWSAMEKGKPRIIEHAEAAAAAVGINVEYLIHGTGPKNKGNIVASEVTYEFEGKTTRVREIGTAGASNGTRGHLYDRPQSITLPSTYATFKIYDDSGEPIVRAGQRVIVDLARRPAENDLALIEIESGIVFKRWCPQPGGKLVVLASISSGQSSLAVSLADVRHAHRVAGVLYE